VAWCRKNAVRRIGTQRNCGPWSKLTVAEIKMTHHARAAWHRENFVRKDCTRAKDERPIQGVRPLRKNLRMHHERKRGTKDQGSKRPLYMRKNRAVVIAIRGWISKQLSPLGRGISAYKARRKTLELEFVK
jgi:hypothetical protein